MPIANCGFPPVAIVPGSNPPRVITGRDALVFKGPTTAVEIGFNPRLATRRQPATPRDSTGDLTSEMNRLG